MKRFLAFVVLWVGLGCLVVGAEVPRVPLLVSSWFSDHAIVQRDAVVPIWGTAAPGVKVSVRLGESTVSGMTDAAGHWRVALPRQEANSQGRSLSVEASDGQKKSSADVVVGDLWYCAGQSNMQLGMGAIDAWDQESLDLDHPNLRLVMVATVPARAAAGEDRIGPWRPSTPATVVTGGWKGFSAVAYTFGRKLQHDLGVPIGLIQAAYGGSAITTWMAPVELADPAFSRYGDQVSAADQRFQKDLAVDPRARHPFDLAKKASELGPTSLFHGMVEPLGPLVIRGILWYQGEADVGDGPLYTKKMNALIAGFRRFSGNPDLPFYFAQIAPFQGYGRGDKLPRFWAAQEAVLATPGTGMALTVDVGNFTDIHPTNKRPVGERLALQALAKTYGKTEVAADGPVFASWEVGPRGPRVAFQTTGPLTSDGPPTGFEVLESGGWVVATSSIEGEDVVLSVPGTEEVKGVRYAWSPTPIVNLTDASGLPARPFSTQP